jgi:hypothetical protein
MEIIASTIIGIITSFFCGRSIFRSKKISNIVTNYESYMALLQYHMDKAYNIIHKDQIMVYSIEATTLPDAEFHKASIDFINLVLKLLGPTLIKEMTFLYGNYDTFVFNLAEYFNTRYDEDEIRKSSVAEMMESEVDVETPEVPYDLR